LLQSVILSFFVLLIFHFSGLGDLSKEPEKRRWALKEAGDGREEKRKKEDLCTFIAHKMGGEDRRFVWCFIYAH